MFERLLIICICWIAMIPMTASDYHYVDGVGLKYEWSVDYRTSITSGKPGTGQRAFYVTEVDDSNTSYAIINSIGYKLSENSTYYAYHPYKWYDEFDAKTIICDYSGQVQNGNDNAAGLSKHDLCIGKVETAKQGSCFIKYNHVGGVIRICLAAPYSGIFTGIKLHSLNNSIPTKATANLLTQELAFDSNTDNISVELQNVTLEEGQPLIAYIMLPPINLSNQKLQISVCDDTGNTFEYPSIDGPNIKAGKLYNIITKDTKSPAFSSSKGVSKVVDAYEYPTAYTEDIAIDKEYNGIIDITTDIKSESAQSDIINYYDLSGIKISMPKGIYLSVNKNGTIKKRISK